MTTPTTKLCRSCSKPADDVYCSSQCREDYVARIKEEERAFLANQQPMTPPVIHHLEAVPKPIPQDRWAGDNCPLCEKAFEFPPESSLHRERSDMMMADAGNSVLEIARFAQKHLSNVPAEAVQEMVASNATLARIVSGLKDELDRAWGSAARWRHMTEHAQEDQLAMQRRLDKVNRELAGTDTAGMEEAAHAS